MRRDAAPRLHYGTARHRPPPRDIFTSDDFYQDKELWTDPRYFRCNSPMGTELQRGILQPPGVNVANKTEEGPWGHCERDVPREDIVSHFHDRVNSAER